MLGKLIEKLRALFDDGGASDRMTQERAEQVEDAEELEPGRDIQAGQIGMFS
jgi:hypothetical protein